MTANPKLVLASGSASRRRLLEAAAVPFEAAPAAVDEEEVKLAMKAEGADPFEVAEALAELKAQRVSPRFPGALVLGADQLLVCEGEWFDKPVDMAGAADHLRKLSGRRHSLLTVLCLVRDGTRIWHHRDEARLTVRPLGEDFIRDYLEEVGEAALGSVGAYQLEGRGIQLFTEISGDFFGILGLPLLPLLEMLRLHKVLAT